MTNPGPSATTVLVQMLPGFVLEMPRLYAVRLDRFVLLFATALSIAASLFFGALPALQVSRVHLVRDLNQRASTVVAGFRLAGGASTRSVLVVAEVALATVLVMGAGLLLRSFSALVSVEPGYDPAQVLTAQVSPSGAR